MKKVMSFAFGLLAAVTFVNATVEKGTAAESNYVVDTQKSKIVWVGKKVTGEHTGNVNLSSGQLLLANNKLKGGTFEIDLTSITVTDVTDKGSNAKLVGHLKSDDFFGVEKFPKAKFVISSVSPKAAQQYEVSGKLTIKGITQEVKFPATVKLEGGKPVAQANITVDRTKYDLKYRSSNFFENLGDKAIDNNFTLNVTLVANPAASSAKVTGK